MRLLFANGVLVVSLGVGFVSPAAAQGGAGKESILKQKANRQQKLKELKAQQQKMVPLPAPAVERLLQMSPEDRERALSQLTPERRQQLEQRLDRLQQLSPDQRQRLQDVYPAFLNLRPARQQALRQEIQELRQMRPALRKDRLNGDARDFSPEEMDILRQVTGIPE
jgi:TolA-binding protein